MLKGFLNQFKKDKPTTKAKPTIIPRAEHTISRNDINRNALRVLYRLHEAGFSAFLVGGCVRDLLLGFKPKDFDVATNARPEEVRRLFKNCRLIGKRFRLAHILFGREIIEVATFRTHHENAHEQLGKISQKGMIIRDNVYGDIEDDAWRRDFRINALYYNIADFTVIDYTGGMQDIKNNILHIIGEPEKRFHEDPVRLLRAVRFMAKLNMHINPETETSLNNLGHLLEHVSTARLFQEVVKIFQEGATSRTIPLLQKYKLFTHLFPQTLEFLEKPQIFQFIQEALTDTDQRVSEGKSVSPAFLFAVLLWHPALNLSKKFESNGMPPYIASEKSLHIVIKQQTQRLAIPRIMQTNIREICALQHRLSQRRGMQPYRLLEQPRFRAGYDLLLLRAKIDESLQELASWWKEFSSVTPDQREKMMREVNKSYTGKPRRKRPRQFHKKSVDKVRQQPSE